MHPVHEKQLKLCEEAIRRGHNGLDSERLRVGVLCGTGHGDHMRGIAFCQALKRHFGPTCHITLLTHFDAGCMVTWDLVRSAQVYSQVDTWVPHQKVGRRMLVSRLAPCFDVFFDAKPYAVGTYWNLLADADHIKAAGTTAWIDKALADERLKPFLDIYLNHPQGNARMITEQYSQWECMAASSGVDVTEADLIPPVANEYECAQFPGDLLLSDDKAREMRPSKVQKLIEKDGGNADWKKVAVRGTRYVVVNNAAGARSATKCAPPQVFKAIVSRLTADGIKCVQVGAAHDAVIPDTIDRLGARVPLVARLIERAITTVTIEGFVAYLARAAERVAVVLFGPTPLPAFAFACNLNLLKGAAQGKAAPCPMGCCFWREANWGARCPLGEEHCVNFEEPAIVADRVAGLCRQLEGVEGVA